MDTTGFFNYPTLAAPEPAPDPGFLPRATEDEWDALLDATETLRFAPGDVVLTAGARDRAFYLLLDGVVAPDGPGPAIAAPATLGAVAFLDGGARAVTLVARSHGEVARLSWDAFEALAARRPALGRAILAELGRGLGARLRAAGHTLAGWTG
ncbi:MAG TPA: cyclic nucleotide-binding domain-containing protein [Solirubrobacteraceae bacterium]|nr:cyclic nucleotide-binding domain-containing protein [Solirubrobacteraceae bacterium]